MHDIFEYAIHYHIKVCGFFRQCYNDILLQYNITVIDPSSALLKGVTTA